MDSNKKSISRLFYHTMSILKIIEQSNNRMSGKNDGMSGSINSSADHSER